MLDMKYVAGLTAAAIVFAGCGVDETETDAAPEAVQTQPAAEQQAWGYEGEAGPESWGDLAQEWQACEVGAEQSPIDIMTAQATEADLSELQLDYGQASLQLEDTGYGPKATPAGEQGMVVGQDRYRLLQFHAHTPSEHTLNGTSYPMEVHFVHQNDAGELAVVGVMVEEGSANESYAAVTGALRQDQQSVTVQDLEALLPNDLSYYTYPGSLTTPPCTEGVRWIVLEKPITMSPDQLVPFREPGNTSRPVMPLGNRELRHSGG